MIYGELGVTPLEIDIKKRILSYWAKLIENKENGILSSDIYRITYEMHRRKIIKSCWIDNVKKICIQSHFLAFGLANLV